MARSTPFALLLLPRKALALVLHRPIRLLWLIACAPIVGCTASHISITARRTPCKVRDIEVSDEVYEANQETWIASCGGKRYACSSTALERRVLYACRALEEPKPQPSNTASTVAEDADAASVVSPDASAPASPGPNADS